MPTLVYTPETAAQQAAIRLMLESTAITELAGGRIWNEPPGDDATFPYVHLEGMNSRGMEAGCGTARNITMRYWAVAGNEFGWLGAWQLANYVKDCLEDKYATLLEGYRMQSPFIITMEASTVDPDAVKAVAVDVVCTVGSKPRTPGV